MGNPITWQNVSQGDASTAWRAMDSAQKSMNGAFDGVGDVIKQKEAIDAGNVVVAGKNNTNSYLDQVNQLGKTPEALQKAITDGSLDRLRASFGPNIDHAATRNAATDLLQQRFAQSEAAIKHGIFTTDAAQQPLVDEIQGYLKSGKADLIAKGNNMLASNPQIRVKAGLYGDANAAGQQLTDRDRATTKFGWEGDTQKESILTAQAGRVTAMMQARASQQQAAAAGVQAAASTMQAKTGRDSLTATLRERADEMILKASKGIGELSSHLASSPEGQIEINKTIAGIADDDARAAAARIRQRLPADAKAGDVQTLMQTIIKPGFWGTLGGKNTSDDDVVKSFEDVYNKGKTVDTAQAENTRLRKELYKGVAANAIDASAAYGNELSKSLGIAMPSVGPVAKADPAAKAAAAELALRKAAVTPVAQVQGTPAQQAIVGLDSALAQTGQAMAKAQASGNTAEVQRLQVLFMQQNAAKQAAMGGQ